MGRVVRESRAEDAAAGGVEILLQLCETAEITVDGVPYVALWLASATAHDLPEHRVVGVATAIISHRSAYVLRNCTKAGEHIW